MDKQELIQKVKELTGDANLDQALDLLDQYTSAQAELYDELHDQVVQARALFSQTQKDQNAGVISFENAKLSLNQVTRQILTILDVLEAEAKAEALGLPVKRRRPSWLLPALAVAAVLTLAGAWWAYSAFSDHSGPEEEQGETSPYCSGFPGNEDAFRVLVLPYLPLRPGAGPLEPHNTVHLRMQELRDRYSIDLESEVYTDSSILNPGKYPLAVDKAAAIGQNCRAEMVIWGTEEALASNRNVILTKYKILSKDNFDLTKLRINDAGALDTISSLSSILTEGAVTGEIEQVIKYLFGLIEFENGDYEQAIASLEEARVEAGDSSAILTKNMLLSESYLKKGDNEMALKSLDAALETHPEYALALNNRAAINYKKKNYEAAAVDLEVANAVKPEDTTIVANRLFTGLAMEKVYIARESVEKLRRIAPEGGDWTAKRSVIEDISRKQDNVIDSTRLILDQNPNNLQALQLQARAYLNRGLFDEAIKKARDILRRDPKNKEAYLILLEAYRKMGREEEFRQTIQRAERNGLIQDSLLSGRKELIRVVKPLLPVN